MTNSNGANNSPVRVVDYLFDQSKGQQQQPARRRSADDGMMAHQAQAAPHQHRLGRGRTDPQPHHHHKKKNLVQKGIAFLKDSTTSVARHPSAASTPERGEGTRPPSPSLPWSPHRRSDLIKTKFASDAEYVQSQDAHQNNNNRSESPQEVPIVEECDSYESDFSGWASPLAGHDFRILPKDGGPYDSQPLSHHDKNIQKLAPKLSSSSNNKRESRSERNRRTMRRKTNKSRQHSHRSSGTGTRHRSHHHHHRGHGGESVVRVAGAFSRFLCGAIPTACGDVYNEHDAAAYETDDEDIDNHGHDPTGSRRRRQQQHRLRELFQPLRSKVQRHFVPAGDSSLDHSFLTATTVSRGEGSPSGGGEERTLFNKYLDLIDSLGLASNSTMQDDDRTAMSSVLNASRYDERSLDETNASSSVITHKERRGARGARKASLDQPEQEQDESLYSVEMAYDKDEDEIIFKKHETALNLFLTPTLTASESSEEEAGKGNEDDHDDGEDQVTASDASVLSHISEKMSIDDQDTEQSLFSARAPSMDDDDHRPMVDKNNNNNNNNNNHDGVNTEFSVMEDDDDTFDGTLTELAILQDANASAAINKNAFAKTALEQRQPKQQQQQQQDETVFATQQHQDPQDDQASPLFTTWDVHQEEQQDSAMPLAAPSFSNPIVDESITTVEEQIEAVFCTKKWMAEEDNFEEIVFTEATLDTTMMKTHGVLTNGTEASIDSILDHRFGLI